MKDEEHADSAATAGVDEGTSAIILPAMALEPASPSSSVSSSFSEAGDDMDDSWMDVFIARESPWASGRLQNTPLASRLLQAVQVLQPKLAQVITVRLLCNLRVEAIFHLLLAENARQLQEHVENIVRGCRRCVKYDIR